MQAWGGDGHDEGSATGSRTDRSECAERPDRTDRTDRAAAAGPSSADAAERVWAPAATGGDLVSLDEDQFAALVRPLRDVQPHATPPPDG
jgi:hypothetical protein